MGKTRNFNKSKTFPEKYTFYYIFDSYKLGIYIFSPFLVNTRLYIILIGIFVIYAVDFFPAFYELHSTNDKKIKKVLPRTD